VTALPNASDPSGPQARPGGTRRFLVALAVTFLLLVGVVLGMCFWMQHTSAHEALGPDKLTFPENRYYGQGK
jgi:hypothetical protein